jgi:hypothetical protein
VPVTLQYACIDSVVEFEIFVSFAVIIELSPHAGDDSKNENKGKITVYCNFAMGNYLKIS